MLFQTSQKLSEKVQQRQTDQADSCDQTPRNVSDVLRDLALLLLCLTLALLAHFGFLFDKLIPSANGCIKSADALQLLALFSNLLQRQKRVEIISRLAQHL